MENKIEAKQSVWQKISFLHCFLLAIFPLLFTYATNFNQMTISDIYRPLEVSVISALILLIFFKLILKNIEKAALLVSIILIWFFSFGRFYLGLSDKFKWPVSQLYYLIIWTIIFFIIATVFLKLKKIESLSRFILYISIILVTFQIGIILLNVFKPNQNSAQGGYASELKTIDSSKLDQSKLPDIYYLIPDAYTSKNILRNDYNFDNSDFINFLKQDNFYVIDQSHNNYSQTALSLSSSLNMTHLKKLLDDGTSNRNPLTNFIHQSTVRQMLVSQGYKTISFSTGYGPTDIKNTDYYFQSKYNFSEFNRLLLDTTSFSYFLKKYTKWNPYDLRYDTALNTFKNLKTLSKIESPKFVFAHIIIPHPPFMLDENGQKTFSENSIFDVSDANHFHQLNPQKQEEYRQGYLKQLQYTNKELKTIINSIKTKTKRPLVIIIQSDHGPGLNLDWEQASDKGIKERMSNFTAYYFSDQKYNTLYQTITPVNSFRVIFNKFFKTDYQLLPDEIYFSSWNHPFRFTNVGDKVK